MHMNAGSVCHRLHASGQVEVDRMAGGADALLEVLRWFGRGRI